VRDKLGVTDAQVDKAFEETAKSNHMDKDQLQQVLYNQGQTVAEFKQTLRKQIERSQYMQFRMQGKTGFTEKDLIQRCNELRGQASGDIVVKASHLLFKVGADASDAEVAAAKSRAMDAYAELQKGADFAELAGRVSDDKGTKGGDLGYFHRGEMVPQFDQIAFTAKVGDISKPVRTQFGFHIIRVEDKRVSESKGCDDEQVKAQVSNELYNRELERQLKLWVDELRKKAYVDVKI
jgi:parvulin-like peptidyl-prolyl isomerase